MKYQRQKSITLLISFLLVLGLPPKVVAQEPITFQYFYDDLGQLVKAVDSTGVVIEYIYDEAGNMVEIRRSQGARHVFDFAPRQGLVGTTVTLQGQAFSPAPGENIVQFNGVPATVTSAISTSLEVIVPPGATTGLISVTVAGQTATSARNFIVIETPVITAIQPTFVISDSLIGGFQVNGENLIDSAFAFSPTGLTVESALIDLDGDSATLVVLVDATALGEYVLIATNAAGSSDGTPSPANTLTVFNSDADNDLDGLTNGQEMAIYGTDPLDPDTDDDTAGDGAEVAAGSDPRDPTNTPSSLLVGEADGPAVSIRNVANPTDLNLPNQAASPTFTILNTDNPTTPNLPGEAVSPVISIENIP